MQDVLFHWLFWTLALFVIIFLRYVAFSGLYHYLLRIRWRERLRRRIFHFMPEKGSLLRREIVRSAIVSLIFAAAGITVLMLWQAGYTRIYLDPLDYHPIWLVLSPVLFLLAQETYYYWIHRWMHLPGVYRYVHAWHHESIETTAWTAFSFHPIEGLVQAIFLPLIVLVLPIQGYIFLLLLMVMTLSATINHAGVEIYPRGFARHRIWRWIIGATHHDLHHKQARYNFGLYFTFWDKWMDTESPKFEKLAEQYAGKSRGRESFEEIGNLPAAPDGGG